ncbi:MAG: hypothetical protein EP348_12050 [Alphaproteobacteria bacterium]|nr:MAG: hypothetical protein EP348_12050 [Alphaproteobacteria bacterium]
MRELENIRLSSDLKPVSDAFQQEFSARPRGRQVTMITGKINDDALFRIFCHGFEKTAELCGLGALKFSGFTDVYSYMWKFLRALLVQNEYRTVNDTR